MLFKTDAVKNFETLDSKGKELVCSALFFSINWFREVSWSSRSHIDCKMFSSTAHLEINCLKGRSKQIHSLPD